jgi:predicted RNA-binding Zn-ribbon protein involved in translation (DUF1610 family)
VTALPVRQWDCLCTWCGREMTIPEPAVLRVECPRCGRPCVLVPADVRRPITGPRGPLG